MFASSITMLFYQIVHKQPFFFSFSVPTRNPDIDALVFLLLLSGNWPDFSASLGNLNFPIYFFPNNTINYFKNKTLTLKQVRRSVIGKARLPIYQIFSFAFNDRTDHLKINPTILRIKNAQQIALFQCIKPDSWLTIKEMLL
jgi:hypothetical protein